MVDDDTITEETIGSADFDADALARATPEPSQPVRSSGAIPTQTGTLWLRREAVP